ncbi:hypothetical protein [Kushneria aurantia]|uniref:Uncharacterized protein n=1 Tax=Kushneria aurantia TaxID=504092 RepID=A0ABV6G058_9GAMM|nr:hypothetical protein [Kushneria aurantia]
MMRVTLDLRCNECGHNQFHMPVQRMEGHGIYCASCNAFLCDTHNLEKAFQAINRAAPARQTPAALSA